MRRRELRAALSGIEGWLWLREAWRLHEAARQIPAGRQATVVEIGSMKGRSAIALAKGLSARGGEGRLYAVDPQEDERYEEFIANLERAGVRQLVEPIRATSHDAAHELRLAGIDVLFVDGSHEYEDVLQDVRDWGPRLGAWGVLGFNDPFWPGVNRALREEVAQVGSPFRVPAFFDNTLFFRYDPAHAWTRSDDRLLRRLRLFLHVGRVWHIYLGRISLSGRLPYFLRWILIRPFLPVVRWILPLLLFDAAPTKPS